MPARRDYSIDSITVRGQPVRFFEKDGSHFFCLTDLAKSADATTDVVMQSYLKNANNLAFLSKWEELNNPDFNPHRLVGITSKIGMNNFYLSMKKWIETARAIGREWRFSNPDASGNMRDEASEVELQVLANLESQNATLLEMGFTQDERLSILAKRAARELEILAQTKGMIALQKRASKPKRLE